MKRKLLYIATLLLIMIFAVVGCKATETTVNEEKTKATALSIDVKSAVMVTGENFVLGYEKTPEGSEGEISFTSSDPQVASVSNEGKITALKAGKAKITVALSEDMKADCEITVADVIVDANLERNAQQGQNSENSDNGSGDEQGNSENGEGNTSEGEQSGSQSDNGSQSGSDESGIGEESAEAGSDEDTGSDNGNANGNANGAAGNANDESIDGQNAANGGQTNGEGNGSNSLVINVGGKEGETLFATITQAIAKAKEGDVILIKSGAYGETVSVNKKLTLTGQGEVKIKKIRVERDAELTMENLIVTENAYPSGNDARVYVSSGSVLNMQNCVLESVSEDELEGGYAVFAEKQCNGLRIEKNTISNFRYGIYVSPTDKEVKITENTLSNMKVGIGFDIRQENSQLNYPAKGEIKDNQFNEVQNKAQFFHYGEEYEGEFSFDDAEDEGEEQQAPEPDGMQE